MFAPRLTRNALLLSVFVLFIALPAWKSQAQDRRTGSGTSLGRPQTATPLLELPQQVPNTQTEMKGLALEGALDPAEYVIGPGDVFSIAISGPVPSAFTSIVTADGFLPLPDARSVRIAGQTLDDARTQALSSLQQQFRNVSVDVALAQPRQFYVHISGAVPVPGRYLASAVTRVSEVLEYAFADTLQRSVNNTEFEPSLRNVTINRKSGPVSVDVRRYLATGDTKFNPYLQDGDIVSVPAYRPALESVYIDGMIPHPGSYDYRPGDTVQDLVAIGTGGVPMREVKQIHISRPNAQGGVDTMNVSLTDLNNPGASSVQLRPRDHVSIIGTRDLGGSATIEGWVNYPGTYPISVGKTRVQDLIALGGGLRDGALKRGAYLERKILPDPVSDMRATSRFDFKPYHRNLLDADTVVIMQTTRLSGMDFLSRRYFAQETRLQNRVSFNLEQAMASGAAPVYLEDGDRLVIPRDEHTIFVLGQVDRPGMIAFTPGQNSDYYIQQAGGLGPAAGEMYVIEAGTGQYLPTIGTEVKPGDWVFVDRKNDLADTAELHRIVLEESRMRSESRIRNMQTILSVVSTTASIILTIVSFSR